MTKIYLVPQPEFPLGELYVTASADKTLATDDIRAALVRHARGDWGDMNSVGLMENEAGLKHGFRLHSVYHDHNGVTFWIITESDRSVTTVLLPDDY